MGGRQVHVVRALDGHSGLTPMGHMEYILNIFKYIQDLYRMPGGGVYRSVNILYIFGIPQSRKPTMTTKSPDHIYLSPL